MVNRAKPSNSTTIPPRPNLTRATRSRMASPVSLPSLVSSSSSIFSSELPEICVRAPGISAIFTAPSVNVLRVEPAPSFVSELIGSKLPPSFEL